MPAKSLRLKSELPHFAAWDKQTMKQFAAIVGMSTLAAVGYGVIHDQITARVCIEYFTIGHPPVFNTTDPTLLGLGWGVIATWWVGVPLGVLLAIAARLGRWPTMTAGQLLRPLLVALLAVGALAFVAAITTYVAVHRGWLQIPEPVLRRISPQQNKVFVAVSAAHLTSYIAGAIAGLVLCIYVLIARHRQSSFA
jgi:hypothetical protein